MIDDVNALREQLAYYRARAHEYDEWWLRQNRYDRGAKLNERWFTEAGEVVGALETFRPTGRVLELAAGTGIWSQQLLPFARQLVLLDGSREMLALAAARLNSTKVRCVEADIFSWRPKGKFDTVFFSFWLSHVPPNRFNDFWELVSRCLAPGGRVFLLDSIHEVSSTALDHKLPPAEATTLTRRLNDGREFQIYKVFYDQMELAKELECLGWRFNLSRTQQYFFYGGGAREVTRSDGG